MTASCFLHGDFDAVLRRCPKCGAGRGSDTTGAAARNSRPTTLADICAECGSGLLNGEHIADYPCVRRAEVAERERDQAREALTRIAYFPFNVMRDARFDLRDVKEIAAAALAGEPDAAP